jgi:hypothetical protein
VSRRVTTPAVYGSPVLTPDQPVLA